MARKRRKNASGIARVYRAVIKHKVAFGAVLLFFGFALFAGAAENSGDTGMSIGMGMMVVGGMAVYMGLRTAYCANCGQRLGKLAPKKCGRCGSNRITRSDPGVGEAVRVKRQR